MTLHTEILFFFLLDNGLLSWNSFVLAAITKMKKVQ